MYFCLPVKAVIRKNDDSQSVAVIKEGEYHVIDGFNCLPLVFQEESDMVHEYAMNILYQAEKMNQLSIVAINKHRTNYGLDGDIVATFQMNSDGSTWVLMCQNL